ncbi:MAG: peptidoglycan-binding protein [Actinomycetia bacterium]|nr:peptidoglycan-binding protein [Actinomycetes bacterium]
MTFRSARTVPLVASVALVLPLGLTQGVATAEQPTRAAATTQAEAKAKAKKIPRSEAKTRPTLKKGSAGPWVKSVQRALKVRPKDGVFSKATGKSVKKFRKGVGLRPKKKVNTRTWRHLGYRVKVPKGAAPVTASPAPPAPPVDAFNYPTLRRGDRSAWVRALQTALGIGADGDFGPKTEAAVRSYQAAQGLAVTGIVDSETWNKLGPLVTPPQEDITTTTAARTSRSHRSTISISQFVNSATAKHVVQRESGGNCAIVSANGKWHGKWQMDANFWSAYGGLAFATKASKATCAEQDIVARAGWIDRWWNPWPTAL